MVLLSEWLRCGGVGAALGVFIFRGIDSLTTPPARGAVLGVNGVDRDFGLGLLSATSRLGRGGKQTQLSARKKFALWQDCIRAAMDRQNLCGFALA